MRVRTREERGEREFVCETAFVRESVCDRECVRARESVCVRETEDEKERDGEVGVGRADVRDIGAAPACLAWSECESVSV